MRRRPGLTAHGVPLQGTARRGRREVPRDRRRRTNPRQPSECSPASCPTRPKPDGVLNRHNLPRIPVPRSLLRSRGRREVTPGAIGAVVARVASSVVPELTRQNAHKAAGQSRFRLPTITQPRQARQQRVTPRFVPDLHLHSYPVSRPSSLPQQVLRAYLTAVQPGLVNIAAEPPALRAALVGHRAPSPP